MDHVCGITRSLFFECPCNDEPLVAPPDGVKFHLGGADDLKSFSVADHEYGLAEKQFSFERLARGDSLLIGERDGEVIFYAWLMHGLMDMDMGVLVPVSTLAAYSYKVFTVQRARGLRICHAYYSFIRRWLYTQGYERLVCRITTGNTPSIHAHARAGFRPKGQLWRISLAGHHYYWVDHTMRDWLPSLCAPEYFNSQGFLVKHEK
jgi:hypothetical protein